MTGFGSDAESWHLRLYVAGQSPKSLRALANLRSVCEEYLHGRFELEIVDLIQQPTLARTDDIVAIPTLVRSHPMPVLRFIGDLSDTQRVIAGLHLESAPAAGGHYRPTHLPGS